MPANVRFLLDADASPGLLPRLLQPFPKRHLTTRTMMADRPLWLQIADHTPDQPPARPERPPSREWALEQINPGTQRAPEAAGGVILVSMNIDPSREEEFNDWYNTEHIPHFN